ncbi:hypothetical protein SAMN04488498_113121 [Mesorhizobium albiziae]|uniref:Uncharacterized protein n=1 Tax=Neomesorhizobium albiziae TaxID=335020 RepID=A0A1I4CJS1_9HYPH|nr:hypothetical protein [Mesorhizobium albiziae]GLS29317.1 hypothetical protein GCM10007937_10250 [Mesorhizobium albiziae]SFK81514.1 hypothetical protein SAMN04488498_113121 [Mesorhizobium albiziae]
MFDRSEIMKAAWALWSAHYDAHPNLAREFEIEEFGFYLSVAWRNARDAAMTGTAKRRASISREIDQRVDIERRRRELDAELASIAG